MRPTPATARSRKRKAQQLANRVIRLFREVYSQAAAAHRDLAGLGAENAARLAPPAGPDLSAWLRRRRAISELPLRHPDLPFRGGIDLAWQDRDGPVITDFKTGAEKDEYATQVGYYAVLWWRCAGEPPVRAETRYPGGTRRLAIEPAGLERWERELRGRIGEAQRLLEARPAAARPGDYCRFCDVRPFCATYWRLLSEAQSAGKGEQARAADAELTVGEQPTEHGFAGRTAQGQPLTVVFEAGLARLQGPFSPGERLRVVRAAAGPEGEVELKPWTEVFHVHPGPGTPRRE
jgi:hypothetical protein